MLRYFIVFDIFLLKNSPNLIKVSQFAGRIMGQRGMARAVMQLVAALLSKPQKVLFHRNEKADHKIYIEIRTQTPNSLQKNMKMENSQLNSNLTAQLS